MKEERKTTDAQKRAFKNYYEKNKANRKTISLTLTAEQAAYDRAALEANGITPGQLWRNAIDSLPIQPKEVLSKDDEEKR